MELTMAKGFSELNEQEMMCSVGGGLFLAILSGLGTVGLAIGTAYIAPPGTKVKSTAGAIIGGILLTAEAYEI